MTEQHFVARFFPQVWMGDQAIDVDPQGPNEWDVTTAFTALDESYREVLLAEMKERGEALDPDDALRHDPNAPAWVRRWSGPFSIYVRRADYIWRDPNGDGWIDAWNGWYEAEAEAREDGAAGIGRPWILNYGEGLITADEQERRLSGTPEPGVRFLADGTPFDAGDVEVHVSLPDERLQIKLTSEGLIVDLYNPDGSGPQATNSCTYDEFIDLFLGDKKETL